MRIGFDVSPLYRSHPPGVVRATRGLVDALERRGLVEIVRLAPPKDAGLLRWRQVDLTREIARNRVAGVHSPVSAFTWFGGGARVATVHELPWRHGEAENAGSRHRFWAAFGARRAQRVVVPTDFVARDLAAACPRARDRIRVVPWGVHPAFTPAAPGSTAVAPEPREDYVLLAGGGRPKKRAADALAAWGRFAGAALPAILITGTVADAERAALLELALRAGVADRLRFAGGVEDDALAELYRRAQAVLVLSRSEGFGFPVVEALACGTPVIVAAGTAQAEVAGAAGLAIDLADEGALARALHRVRTERETLRAAGLARAAEFTWDKSAERVEALWRELAP